MTCRTMHCHPRRSLLTVPLLHNDHTIGSPIPRLKWLLQGSHLSELGVSHCCQQAGLFHSPARDHVIKARWREALQQHLRLSIDMSQNKWQGMLE